MRHLSAGMHPGVGTPRTDQMALAFFAMLVITAMTLLTPYLLKVAIDQYIIQNNQAGLAQICLITAGAFVMLYAATAAQQYLLDWVGQHVLANLRSELFTCHGFRSATMIPISVGVTVSRVMNDVATINELLSQGLITLTGDTLVLVGIVVIMLTMSPKKLALMTFIVLPLMILATYLFSRQARVAYRETRTRVARVVGDLAEDIAGVRVIQAFGQENTSQERFNTFNEANRKANINAMSLSFIFLPSIEFLGMLSTAIVLWFGGRAAGR